MLPDKSEGGQKRQESLAKNQRGLHNFVVMVLAVLISGLLFAAGLLKAAEEQEPPDEITIQTEGYKARKKGPVEFSHSDHAENYDTECKECHHVYEDGKNVWEEGDHVKKCVECHDPNVSKGKVKKLMIAYHKNCKDCHKQRVKDGLSDDAPYKKCKDCHEKKS